jgi:endonuclease/exonuclease/phosphatase family metal-dependent hydrolase
MWNRRASLALGIFATLAACASQPPAPAPASAGAAGATIRVATYNTSLNDDKGELIAHLRAGDANASRIAAVIQHAHPDLVLLNEFDYDAAGEAADLFRHRYLEVSQHGQAPIHYPYLYTGPVNTGVPSGFDLDRNGKIGGGNDAWGFGQHPGQYGMLVLSKFPIDAARARSFQLLKWSAMPGAKSPVDPATGQDWYPPAVWSQLRLSSKSHWDLPVRTPLGEIHFLVSHPTPPVFDGPEDRNGIRNRDEIRLWNEYISGAPVPWLCDDRGACGGLAAGASFVIAGDQNSDPHDGDSTAINQLLSNPRVRATPLPRSEGGPLLAAKVGGGNIGQRGPDAEDTGDFGPKVGNLHLDYVLPSTDLSIMRNGIFWPRPDQEGADWIDATDHHLVWYDLKK